MRYSFTGSHTAPWAAHATVGAVLATLRDGTEYTTGCSWDVDTWCALGCFDRYPYATQRLVVPAAPHNQLLWYPESATALHDGEYHYTPKDELGRSFCHRRYHHSVVLEHMPPAATDALAYRQRNMRLVDHCDPALTGVDGALVAFPLHEERRQPRSGTWMTVRMAQRRGVRVEVHVLCPLG